MGKCILNAFYFLTPYFLFSASDLIPGPQIWARTGPTKDARPRTSRYNWGTCSSLVVNPVGYFMAALACERDVYLSFDFGSTWLLVSQNLPALMDARLRTFPKTVLIVSLDSLNLNKLVLCGTYSGVFALGVDEFNYYTKWTRFGTTADLPQVPVRHLFYQRAQDVLYAFTFGRGTYTLPGAMAVMRMFRKTAAFPPACPMPRARPNAFIDAYYSAFPIPATPVCARCFTQVPPAFLISSCVLGALLFTRPPFTLIPITLRPCHLHLYPRTLSRRRRAPSISSQCSPPCV